jgi:hypothetical protein
MTTLYNRAFEHYMAERGYSVRCMWAMKGPKDTAVTGLEMLAVTGPSGSFALALVTSYGADGWSVFSESGVNNTDATLADFESRMVKPRILSQP